MPCLRDNYRDCQGSLPPPFGNGDNAHVDETSRALCILVYFYNGLVQMNRKDSSQELRQQRSLLFEFDVEVDSEAR